MSFEPLRNEWIEIHGTLLFDEQHPSAADRGLTGRHKSQMRIGSLVAWYYPESHTLTLWGLTGIKGIRETQGNAPFTPDDNVTAVWQGIERAMQRQFPDLRIIVAPTAPFTLPAENKAWNRFLEAHDYRVDADNGERAIRTV